MTLYTFLTLFLIAWAIAVLVTNWKHQRKFDESQAEIERLHQRIEELKREIEKQEPTKGFEGLRLMSGDEEEETTN